MKRFNIYILIALLSIGFVSCESFLEEKPYQAVSVDDAIRSNSDAQVALNGCYDGLQEIELFARNYYVVADLAADNSRMNSQNAGRFINIYQWNITSNEGYGTGIWNRGYGTIFRINNLINSIPLIEGGDEAEKARMLGEAKVLRALMYHTLVNYFSQPYNFTTDASHLGVPLLTEIVEVSAKPGRATVAEVYAQILADLEGENGAISLLGSGESAFYIDVYAAYALLSRVYLYMEDWTNARDYANLVINSGKYSLISKANYIESWVTDIHDEQIFYLRFDEIDNWSVDMLGQMYMESGYGDILCTNDLLSLYEGSDVRANWFRVSGDNNFIEKFSGRGRVGIDNIPIFRLAEMYLNAAEAESNLTHDQEAIDLINEITDRAGATEALETGAALLVKIKTERRKELCFEGHRLWDLQRWNEPIVRNDRTNPDVIDRIDYPNYLFAYPIPDREIQVNSVIAEQQNPGY